MTSSGERRGARESHGVALPGVISLSEWRAQREDAAEWPEDDTSAALKTADIAVSAAEISSAEAARRLRFSPRDDAGHPSPRGTWRVVESEPVEVSMAEPSTAKASADEPEAGEARGEEATHAQEALLRRLGRSGMTEKEARDYLREREIPEADAVEILERAHSWGYLDDAVIAEQIRHTHGERKKLGRAAVVREMRRRGIESAVIDATLEGPVDDEARRADEVATDRARRLTGLDREIAERRLYGFLQRRGYSDGIVTRAVQKALDDREREDRGDSVFFVAE